MKRIFGTYRPERLTSPVSLDGNLSLNGTYTPSFFLSNQFHDWTSAGLTSVKDMEIPEENYTGEIVPWVPKLTRFLIGEYNEEYVDPIVFSESVQRVGARFDISIFDYTYEAKEWIRSNTNLEEVSEGKFLLRQAFEDPITHEQVEAKYLEIV